MTAEELLAANNIGLSDTKPGRHYAICPRCSHTRSKAHQSAKCLGVTIDEKGVRFFCNHCDYAGGGYFNGKAIAESRTKISRNGGRMERADGYGAPATSAKCFIAYPR